MTRRRIAVITTLGLLLGACGEGATTATTAATTTTVPTTTVPTTAATTTLPTTTTLATTTTTTTTTIPALDRSDPSTVGRMRADLDALVASGPRVSGSAEELAAVAYFAAVSEKVTGVPTVIQPVPLPTGAESANAWVEVGSGHRVLLLGAHIDSVHGSPGADDNGSGVVLLLELLRRLVEDAPRLTVQLVAFGAEERIADLGHHFGSRHAVLDVAALPDFMISVDMVGLGAALQVVDHRDSDPGFADQIAQIAADADIPVGRLSRGEISDHVPYARAGVAAAHLWRPDNPTWHTPNDDTVGDQALLVTLALLEAIVEALEPRDLGAGEHQPM